MSKKTLIISLSGLVLLGLFGWAAWYFAWFQTAPQQKLISQEAANSPSEQPSQPPASVAYAITPFTQGLFVPWSLVFTDTDRLLVSERNGAIRIIENGKLLDDPLATFKEVSQTGEEGLMGLVMDPDYADNNMLYACLAYEKDGRLQDKVISFKDNGNSISDTKVLLDNIPAAKYHAGCRLLFLPDKTLLISTGDATDRNQAQDKNSLAGKILRINRDGSMPNDNPFPGSLIWTIGHRNPQGLAWDSEHETLWSSEHGPSVFDGPAGGDEINLIEKGKNYGWPLVHHKQNKNGLESPHLEFTPAVAPGSLMYYSADLLPQFKNHLFFGALAGEGLYHLTIDPNNSKRISAFEELKDIAVGRIREVVQGPDGAIYFTTSNRDGRGDVRKDDDKVYRLAPKN